MASGRLLIIEDERRLRETIGSLLHAYQPALAANAKEALALLDTVDPSLIVCDLGLPDLDGVELIAQMVARRPSTPILVLTVAATEARILAALRAGARGYLFKEDLGRRLETAVEEALLGGVPLSPAVAQLLLSQVRGGAPPATTTQASDGVLTQREREVLERLARSLTYDEAATDLGVSVNTVRVHVRSLYEKLEVSSRTEAVMAAMARGLLPRE
jgi:DNA-binding NarL/FixJ family response regulator